MKYVEPTHNKYLKDMNMPLHLIEKLNDDDIYLIGDLIRRGESSVNRIPKIGSRKLENIKGYLRANNLHFGMETQLGDNMQIVNDIVNKVLPKNKEDATVRLIIQQDVAENFKQLYKALAQLTDEDIEKAGNVLHRVFKAVDKRISK
tara:strand:+ start:255 stop:695 length:441 start_codon:yes stop_codon:yes gene_type:complete